MSVSKTYAPMLYSVAKDEGIEKAIYDDLEMVSVVVAQNPDYVKILSSPKISKTKAVEMIDDDFRGKVGKYVLNFLKLLAEKRKLEILCECVECYKEIYNSDNNIMTVNITTARGLTTELREKLTEKLKQKYGLEIVLKMQVDSNCMGGIIIECDGTRLDYSVKEQIENMKRALVKE